MSCERKPLTFSLSRSAASAHLQLTEVVARARGLWLLNRKGVASKSGLISTSHIDNAQDPEPVYRISKQVTEQHTGTVPGTVQYRYSRPRGAVDSGLAAVLAAVESVAVFVRRAGVSLGLGGWL